MRIPKVFYLNGFKWTTSRKKNLKDDEGSPCWGLTDPDKKHIYIDKDTPKSKLEWAFWHEYGHAWLEESGVTRNTGGISDLAEENICDMYAKTMVGDKTVTFKRGKK